MKLEKRPLIQSIIIAFLASVSMHLSLNIISYKDLIDNMQIKHPHVLFRLLWDIKMSLNGYNIQAMIIWAALTVLVYVIIRKETRIYIAELILSALFSFFQVFGYSYKMCGSWDMIFGNYRNFVKAALSGFGYLLLFYVLIRGLIRVMEKYPFQKPDEKQTSWFSANRKSIIIVALLVILFWLPHLIAYFPGLTNYDFFDGLDSFYGRDTNSIRVTIRLAENVTMNNNNPVLQTMWGVLIMKIGNFLGSPYIGLFLYVSIQTVCYALVISYTLYYMAYRGVNKRLRIALFCIFVFVPVHPNYAFTTLKDTNWTFFILLYLLSLVELLTNTKVFFARKRNTLLLFIWTLMVLFLRNNGFYVALFTSVAFAVAMRHYWKKLIITLFGPIVIYLLVVNVVYPALYISPGNAAAAYSAPVQQLARLATENPKAFEEEDIEIINKVFDFNAFLLRYNPELADPVMSSYKKNRTDEEWSAFMRVWLKYLKKYPLVFIQATMNGTYGYFYPSASNWITYATISPPAEPYGLVPYTALEPFHTEMTKIVYCMGSVPGLGMFVSIGFYTCWLMLIFVYLIRRKQSSKILLLVPFITILLTAIASPSNTMFRYVYPVIVCTPVLTALLGVMEEDDYDPHVRDLCIQR